MIAQSDQVRRRRGMELYSNALQAIAVGYLVTSLALLHLRVRGQIGLFVALVLGYGALLMFVPFAGHPAGTLERTANLPRYIDELVLGNFRHDHSFTWVMTSLGFAATVLLGAMAGHLLRARLPAGRKLLWLVTIGLACMAGGWLWSYWLPLNRHLWTSSMILWAGGISFLLVALFYAVIDVAGIKRWAFPLVVIGANALLAYVLDPVFDRIERHGGIGPDPTMPRSLPGPVKLVLRDHAPLAAPLVSVPQADISPCLEAWSDWCDGIGRAAAVPACRESRCPFDRNGVALRIAIGRELLLARSANCMGDNWAAGCCLSPPRT